MSEEVKSDYGTTLLNATEEYERDAAEARLVFAFGATLFQDGNQWCCLLGVNIQEGHAVFSDTPIGAIEKMRAYLYSVRNEQITPHQTD